LNHSADSLSRENAVTGQLPNRGPATIKFFMDRWDDALGRCSSPAHVQKLRRQVAHGHKMKHVPALYLATAMALQGMTKQEIEALKLRIKEKRV